MALLFDWFTLLRREFSHYSIGSFQKDLLAGLTVAAVALPLALAFGVASGADAAAGLVTAIIAGVVIAILGGSPYQISGPTGAMSAVLIVLASRYGLNGIWIAGLLAGIMILALGLLRLGRVVSFIPSPVIAGFTSGIALIIAIGQIDNALGIKTPAAETVLDKLRYYVEHGITPNLQAVLLTLTVIGLMALWPRFKQLQRIPGSLVGIIVATLMATMGGFVVPTIGAIPRTILLENRLQFGAIPWQDVPNLIVPAMSIAALGAIESLLCGAVAGNMTGIRLHNNVELMAQGVGNIIIPFFGGVPATAAIARTSVNVKSGGVTRMASIIHGVALLLAALLAASLIGRVPLSALAGVLLVTAWRMNEWHAIHFFFGKRLKHAMVAFTITLIATVLLDLTQAIVIGFGISTMIFIAQMSDLQVSRQPVDVERLPPAANGYVVPPHSIAIYYVSGTLFFAAARNLIERIEAADGPDSTLILSLRGVPLVDATGIEVLREVLHRQKRGGGDLLLTGVQPRVETILQRSGFADEIGQDHFYWSADRAILAQGVHLADVPLPDVTDSVPDSRLDSTLVVTPHEDRTHQSF